jgi:hypothetical protein
MANKVKDLEDQMKILTDKASAPAEAAKGLLTKNQAMLGLGVFVGANVLCLVKFGCTVVPLINIQAIIKGTAALTWSCFFG